jgi:fructokinase
MIYTVGECVFDIIFKQGNPQAATPGGSMLNTSVSLGRLGLLPNLITEFGLDQVGELVLRFLKKNKVNTDLICRQEDHKSAISLAFLDDRGDSQYSFYKNHPEERLKIEMPHFTSQDLFLFGSIFSVEAEVRPQVLKLLNAAKLAGSIIIYDPNIRKPHQNQMPEFAKRIKENFKFADIIRASDEDFRTAFNIDDPSKAYNLIGDKNKILIYTQNKDGIWFFYQDKKHFLKVPQIKVKSTIGAGDNFNAGIIFELIQRRYCKNDLPQIDQNNWDEILGSAVRFSQEVCQSFENYISWDFANLLLKEK